MAFKMKGFSPFNKGKAYTNGAMDYSKSAMPKTYAQAYKDRDMKTYGDLTQEEYTKEAKRQNVEYKNTGKWDYKNAPKVTEEKKGNKTTRTVDSKNDVVETKGNDRKTMTTTTNKTNDNVSTQKNKAETGFEGKKQKTTTTVGDNTYKTKIKYDKEGNVKKIVQKDNSGNKIKYKGADAQAQYDKGNIASDGKWEGQLVGKNKGAERGKGAKDKKKGFWNKIGL